MKVNYEAELNPQQFEAVEHVEGPILILAGAGSGKTRTITFKIAYLVEGGFALPDEILAVTFTNKAADEMRERVERLVGYQERMPWMSTFHSLGVRLLRQHAPRVGYRPDFAICDVDDQKRLMKQVYQELDLTDEDVPLQKTRSVISNAKNKGWGPEKYLASSQDFESEVIYEIFSGYQSLLERSNGADFDDLILLTVRLLRENEDLRVHYGSRFQYLLIDEYQDTNAPQYELVRLLTSQHQNVSAVGDEDQSIYGFRGADINNILRFEKDFPGARIVKLEQNYRSTQNILDAATAVVSNNISRKDKVLWTQSAKGESITVFVAEDAFSEADFVAQEIWSRLREGADRLAVLYRTNFQSRQFEEALRRRSIPYKLVGGVSFYQRKEVRDALAYLRLAVNPEDDISLGRIINEPPRGIGRVTQNRLRDYAGEHELSLWRGLVKGLEEQAFNGRVHSVLKKFRDLIDQSRKHLEWPLHIAIEKILDTSGYFEALEEQDTDEAANRILNLRELITVARESEEQDESLQDFLDQAALHADIDDFDTSAKVTLMTLHNAKGLEFPVVFLAGCEEGLFPHSRSIAENDLEEERRLCYVGLTRAQEKLYLSYSRRRRFYGREGNEFNQPSRFLHEIPSELVETSASASPHTGRTPSSGPVFLGGQDLKRPKRKKKVYTGKTFNSAESVRQELRAKARKGRGSSNHFSPGSIIIHEKFGKGRVLKIEETPDDLKVTVQFPGVGTKKMLQSYARLKLA